MESKVMTVEEDIRNRIKRKVPSIGGRVTHTVYPTKYMVVTGELTTGFQFYGMFDNAAVAGRWATLNIKGNAPYRVHNMHDVEGRI